MIFDVEFRVNTKRESESKNSAFFEGGSHSKDELRYLIRMILLLGSAALYFFLVQKALALSACFPQTCPKLRLFAWMKGPLHIVPRIGLDLHLLCAPRYFQI